MKSREIVRRAVKFENPPRIPFWQDPSYKTPYAPDDVCNIWEMDRQKAGWYFDTPGMDDWGCEWDATDVKNMGQVVKCPLINWSELDAYRPPNPCDPFYYERLGPLLAGANDRYVVVTAHSLLFSRLHKLRGFANTMQDFYYEPERVHRTLEMILEFKIRQCEVLHERFSDSIDGLFMTDDWGTQQGTFISKQTFDEFFAPRYRKIFETIHGYGWHVILHSCGRINAFVPTLIDLGVDVLNMQQTLNYGLEEFGEKFRGKVCFLATVDIQATLPYGIESKIREEARRIVRHWGTPEGGVIVFGCDDWESVGIKSASLDYMFDEFAKLQYYWQANDYLPSQS